MSVGFGEDAVLQLESGPLVGERLGGGEAGEVEVDVVAVAGGLLESGGQAGPVGRGGQPRVDAVGQLAPAVVGPFGLGHLGVGGGPGGDIVRGGGAGLRHFGDEPVVQGAGAVFLGERLLGREAGQVLGDVVAGGVGAVERGGEHGPVGFAGQRGVDAVDQRGQVSVAGRAPARVSPAALSRAGVRAAVVSAVSRAGRRVTWQMCAAARVRGSLVQACRRR